MDIWGGDERYTRLIREHGRSLLHLAILLTGDRDDAEDVVQDAVIAVAAKWPLPQTTAYLRKAVANRAIDLLRSRRPTTDDVPDLPMVEHGFFRHEDDEQFFARVAGLPERQRAAIVLRYWADLDDRAIARILDCSPATVRSHVMRGLDRLRASALKEAEA